MCLGHVFPRMSFNTLLSQYSHCLTNSKNEVFFSCNQVSFATSQWDYRTAVYDLVKWRPRRSGTNTTQHSWVGFSARGRENTWEPGAQGWTIGTSTCRLTSVDRPESSRCRCKEDKTLVCGSSKYTSRTVLIRSILWNIWNETAER